MLKQLICISALASSSLLFAPIQDFDILGSICKSITNTIKEEFRIFCGQHESRGKCLTCCSSRYGSGNTTMSSGGLISKKPNCIEKACRATCPS